MTEPKAEKRDKNGFDRTAANHVAGLEQLRYLADQTLSLRVLPGTLIYLSLFIANVWVNSYHKVHPDLVATACILLLILGICRVILFVWFREIHCWNPRLWRVLFFAGTLGISAIWSLTWAVAIFWDGLVPTTNLSVMMTIGITCAGVATLAPDRYLVLLFLLLMFLPTPTAILLNGAPERFAVVFLFAIGVPFLASVGLRLNREFWHGLRSKVLLEQRAKELAIARDSALAGDRAKSEFLARMSHEIRTPMNGVTGMTELLLSTELNERQHHFATSIHSSAKALLNVINDILDFSKIEAGKLALENHTFNLRHLLEEQVSLFAESAHRKGLELTCLIPSDLIDEVTGDANRLRQILTNLLGNALKFTEQGEIAIRVHQENFSQKRCEYRFEVEDTGPGIPPLATHHIFDSFSQADNSTTRKFSGTGLGLAICRQLCELMGGEIGVKSKPGTGSTFWFTLRLETLPSNEEEKSTSPHNTVFRRILVLDNCRNSRLVMIEMLNIFNLGLQFANSNEEMLGLLQYGIEHNTPFDLVIVNSDLANKPLFDLIDLIHSCTSTSPVKLLLLSPVTADYGMEQQSLISSYVFLRKPLLREPFYRFMKKGLMDSWCHEPLKNTVPSSQQTTDAADYPPVLLVEDNPVNQEVAIAMLALFGYSVEVAENGLQACQMAATGLYSIILMDCQMPEMDGYQATIRIRERERNSGAPRLPIIAITGNAMQGDREKALAVGMDDYLNKPYTHQSLQKVLHLWIENK